MGSKKSFRVRLAFSSILMALLLVPSACGAGTRSTFVDRKALYSENMIKLYVWNTKYDQIDGGHISSRPLLFQTKKDIGLEELQQAVLKSNQQTTAEMKGEGLFIKKENDQGCYDYFYIYEDPDHWGSRQNMTVNKRTYWITSMRANFGYGYSSMIDIIFPLYAIEKHLIPAQSFERLSIANGYSHEIDSQYTLDDFYDFYQQSGYFDVSKENNKLVLGNILVYKYISTPESIVAGKQTYDDSPTGTWTYFEHPIEISVESREGKSFVIFKLLE